VRQEIPQPMHAEGGNDVRVMHLSALNGELPGQVLQFLRNRARILQDKEIPSKRNQVLRDGNEVWRSSRPGARRVVTARYSRIPARSRRVVNLHVASLPAPARPSPAKESSRSWRKPRCWCPRTGGQRPSSPYISSRRKVALSGQPGSRSLRSRSGPFGRRSG